MMKTSFQSGIDNNNDNLEKIDSNERVFTVFFLKKSGYKFVRFVRFVFRKNGENGGSIRFFSK